MGAGPDLERIRQAIARERLEAHVTLTGALTQQAVRDQLDRADIFVLPSLAEGIPVVLMEAMASGVPCVSTPVNGIPELIRHGQTGLLALPGDMDSLVEQLERLVREPALRDILALAARDKLLADFDLSRNVTQLAQIFRAFPAHADLEKPAGP